MADIPPVVTVARAKWQRLIPVSMEVDADLIDIWATDADARRRAYGDRMTDEPERWAIVQWDDGTVSLTDVSLLDKAGDGERHGSGEPG